MFYLNFFFLISLINVYYPGFDLFGVTITHSYNAISFKKDMKTLYSLIGFEKKPIVFLITSAQIVEEGLVCYC
jgi:dynein heavy chain